MQHFQLWKVSRTRSLQSHKWGNQGKREIQRSKNLMTGKDRSTALTPGPRTFPMHHAICISKRKYPGTKMLPAQSLFLSNSRPPPNQRVGILLSSHHCWGPPSPQFTFSKTAQLEVKQFSRSTISRYFTQKMGKPLKTSSSKLWQCSVLN